MKYLVTIYVKETVYKVYEAELTQEERDKFDEGLLPELDLLTEENLIDISVDNDQEVEQVEIAPLGDE